MRPIKLSTIQKQSYTSPFQRSNRNPHKLSMSSNNNEEGGKTEKQKIEDQIESSQKHLRQTEVDPRSGLFGPSSTETMDHIQSLQEELRNFEEE